jgi:hypothetical protein
MGLLVAVQVERPQMETQAVVPVVVLLAAQVQASVVPAVLVGLQALPRLTVAQVELRQRSIQVVTPVVAEPEVPVAAMATLRLTEEMEVAMATLQPMAAAPGALAQGAAVRLDPAAAAVLVVMAGMAQLP